MMWNDEQTWKCYPSDITALFKSYCERRKPSFNQVASLGGNMEHSQLLCGKFKNIVPLLKLASISGKQCLQTCYGHVIS